MITLNVNGEARQYDGDGDMPLLWYLRDLLTLTGTKYGCGKGLCGSCTVHLNGNPVRACVIPASAAASTSCAPGRLGLTSAFWAARSSMRWRRWAKWARSM